MCGVDERRKSREEEKKDVRGRPETPIVNVVDPGSLAVRVGRVGVVLAVVVPVEGSLRKRALGLFTLGMDRSKNSANVAFPVDTSDCRRLPSSVTTPTDEKMPLASRSGFPPPLIHSLAKEMIEHGRHEKRCQAYPYWPFSDVWGGFLGSEMTAPAKTEETSEAAVSAEVNESIFYVRGL